jgi:D-alanyl-lipoteichoic acid acyltransferase DltB (MBOAT superfamily)
MKCNRNVKNSFSVFSRDYLYISGGSARNNMLETLKNNKNKGLTEVTHWNQVQILAPIWQLTTVF